MMENEDKRDAERWRALMSSARIRVMGTAGFDEHGKPREGNGGYLHMGVEFWTMHDAPSNELSVAIVTNYADFLRGQK